MDSSLSTLKTVVERIRGYLDDPDFDAKYTDQYLVQHVVGPALVEVLSKLALADDAPVVLKYDLSLVVGQECYTLPPTATNVMRVCQLDEDGRIYTEWVPRGSDHYREPNWSLEGNMICFRPYPVAAEDLEVWYTTNGDVQAHYATDGNLTSTTVLRLGTPTLGLKDRRVNAYGGQILRLLDTSGVVEERVIESHDPSANSNGGTVTVRQAFTYATTGTGKTYEIMPAGSEGLTEAISCAAAMILGTWRNISQAKYMLMLKRYQAAWKVAHDAQAYKQARIGRAWQRSTVDNPNRLA